MKPNQRVAVEVVDERGPSRFPSRIEEVASNHLTLAGPTDRGVPLRLAVGTQLRVVLFHDQGVHAFDTTVEQCDLYPIPLLRVHRPDRIVALQRRKYFREAASVRTICRHQSGEEIKLEGWTRNVSGGGFALRTHQLSTVRAIVAEHAATNDNSLMVEVGLPDSPLRAVARLAWWEIDEEEHYADLALEFVELPDSQREKLIRYIFTLQRTALKKGAS